MPGSTVYVVFHSMHCACGWPGWWWWWLGEDTLAPRASSDNFRGGRNISRYGPSDVTKAPMWVRLPWRHILVCCVYVYACGRRCTCFGFVYFCFFLCPSLIPRVHFSAVRFHNQGFHEILNFGLALHSPSPPRPTRPAFVVVQRLHRPVDRVVERGRVLIHRRKARHRRRRLLREPRRNSGGRKVRLVLHLRDLRPLGDLVVVVKSTDELLEEHVVLKGLLLERQQPLLEGLPLQDRLGRRLAARLAEHRVLHVHQNEHERQREQEERRGVRRDFRLLRPEARLGLRRHGGGSLACRAPAGVDAKPALVCLEPRVFGHASRDLA
mmetsp:Transcript_10830/g.28870  ORF Transcript_10830/g.28870 Transcript_10830/m.28870 type:complete len:324 (-) Transcript_10830:2496-3467(-)